jgi:hypothetical protein
MRKMLLGAVILTLPIAACKKTGDNQYQVQTPTIGTDTHTVTTPSVDVGTKSESISTPVVGTKKDTIVIDKPVVGTKKTEGRTNNDRKTRTPERAHRAIFGVPFQFLSSCHPVILIILKCS